MQKDAKGYREYYVAFLDILGFKNIVLNKSFDEVNTIFNLIFECRDDIYSDNIESSIDQDFRKTVEETVIRVTSDSIVLATPAKYINSLAFVAECCRRFQAAVLKKGILIRGAISKGDFYLHTESMFGEALIDSYISEENDAIYPRIILDKKMVNEYLKRVSTSTVIYLTDFIVKDIDEYYFVNYLMYYLNDLDDVVCLKKFINEKLSSPKIRGGVREKYLWLKHYFNDGIEYRDYFNFLEIDSKYIIDEDVTRGK